MGELTLSVIVPTYNRAATLHKMLGALLPQPPGRLGYEILVVDDGSTDDTPSVVQGYVEQGAPIRFFACPHRGPAAARNVGVDHARGQLILFTGDDMIAPPRFLQVHIDTHKRHPASEVAIVGDVRWSPELAITPLMYWLDHGGPYFHFYEFSDGERVDHCYFVTANLSLKRAFLADERFDETFIWAALEDMELGHRMMQRGLVLFFKSIPVYHLHTVTLDSAARRMYKTGRAACRLEQKWPEITGLENTQRPRLHFLFRHGRLSADVDRCFRQVAGWLGVRTPVSLCRYILSYARWRGYVAEREAEMLGTG